MAQVSLSPRLKTMAQVSLSPRPKTNRSADRSHYHARGIILEAIYMPDEVWE